MRVFVVVAIVFSSIILIPGFANAAPQEVAFEIVLPEAADVRDFDLALDSRTGDILVVWQISFLQERPRGIQSAIVRDVSSENASVKYVNSLSQEDLNSERPRVVYHADLKGFLVTWVEVDHQSIKTQAHDIGGRFLASSGKPKGGSLHIISRGGAELSPRPIPWLKSDVAAPSGAAFYLAWLELFSGSIQGQWITNKGKPIGEVEIITTLAFRPSEIGSLVRVGAGDAILGLTVTEEKNPNLGGGDPGSSSIQFLRFSPTSGKPGTISSHSGSANYKAPLVLTLTDKKLLASAMADIDRNNPDENKILAFAVKNRKKLKSSRKETDINGSSDLPIEHALVQLDNGDIYSIIFHLSSTFSIQQVDTKGKAKSERMSLPGVYPYNVSFAAIALPDQDAILIVYTDISQDRSFFAVKGMIVRP